MRTTSSNEKHIDFAFIIFSVFFVFSCVAGAIPAKSNENNKYKENTSSINKSIKNLNNKNYANVDKIIELCNYAEEEYFSYIEEYEEEVLVNYFYTEQDIIDISRILYIECGGVYSDTEKACVAWTILNRCDLWNQTIYDVVRAPYQYDFQETAQIRDDLYNLSIDVLNRWCEEKSGLFKNCGRVLPAEYIAFYGDGYHNYFYDPNSPGIYWDYSYETPYAN